MIPDISDETDNKLLVGPAGEFCTVAPPSDLKPHKYEAIKGLLEQ